LRCPQSRRDTGQISRSKPDSLHRTPAGFTVLALDGSGLCDILPARPTSAASYPVSVRRVATLLHASFRRFLAVPPLRFASASPPSGCTGDFHPQAVGHVRHTGRCAPPRRWPEDGPSLTAVARAGLSVRRAGRRDGPRSNRGIGGEEASEACWARSHFRFPRAVEGAGSGSGKPAGQADCRGRLSGRSGDSRCRI